MLATFMELRFWGSFMVVFMASRFVELRFWDFSWTKGVRTEGDSAEADGWSKVWSAQIEGIIRSL